MPSLFKFILHTVLTAHGLKTTNRYSLFKLPNGTVGLLPLAKNAKHSSSYYCSFSLSITVFPDPSLTPENLSTVLDSMEDGLWELFSQSVNIPVSEIWKFSHQYPFSARRHKRAVIPHIISTHPSLSWRIVANALYQMRDDSSHRALDHLQQKFPTGNTYWKHHQCAPAPHERIPRGSRGSGILYEPVAPLSSNSVDL